MADKTKRGNKNLQFVDARLRDTRLVSEQVSSEAAQVAPVGQPVKVRTESSSAFSVGLDDPKKPKIMTVELTYKVTHFIDATNQKLVEYDARHTGQFEIHRQSGIKSWVANIPSDALAPYFAFLHSIAMNRAEQTFLQMGVRGVGLPRISDHAKSEKEPVARVAPPLTT